MTKTGLVSYLILLVCGGILSTAGVDSTYNFIVHTKLCERMLIALITLDVIYVFIRVVDKIHWLGNLHVWLDQKTFGFLFKSNSIIIKELMLLLEPGERAAFDRLMESQRTEIAQSIFSQLAEDQSIFENLLRRGIFRSWILYWIMIYGVFVFLLLSVLSFSKLIIATTIDTKAFFTSIWVIAILHLILSILQGYNLISVTKRIIREIAYLHQGEIVSILRNRMKQS